MSNQSAIANLLYRYAELVDCGRFEDLPHLSILLHGAPGGAEGGGSSRIEPIVAGRYHDRFESVEGRWRFAERDYTLVDMVGDVSRHLRIGLPRADPSDYDARGAST